jgi:LytS/YehU family sensor histidine kinase
MGLGLNNIKKRLRLHFGDKCLLTIHEVSNDLVEVKVMFPLIFAAANEIASSEREQ